MGPTEKNSIVDIKWYSMEAESVLKELDTSTEKGLSEGEVQNRLKEFGKNKIPEAKRRSALMRLLAQFHNTLIYLLIGVAIITAIMDHWIDTFVIIAVVVINSLIGFIQEGKAEQALEEIKKMLSLEAIVIRSSNRQKISAEEIVPGDVIILKSGDKLPADLRIIKAKNLRVEESPLTGESTDVNKHTEPIVGDVVIGDRKNMAYSGTMVTYGEATGVVVTTGENTELGKISRMMKEVEEITTPLLQKIDRFGKVISVIIVFIAAAFFAFGYYFRDYAYVELFMATISLVVAAIPEGLPAIMTITLAIGVQRMAGRNAIIRRLPSVETLGSVSVICSDKTGTLTRNEMTAKTVITADSCYEVEGSGYKPEGEIYKENDQVDVEKESVLNKLIQCVRVCNDSDIVKDDSGEWKLIGTATEGSLLTLAYKSGLKEYTPKRIDYIPFESENKYMVTLNQIEGKSVVFVKGAPERLLAMCSRQLSANGEEELNLDYWEKKMNSVAEQGERVIAAAFKNVDTSVQDLSDDTLYKEELVFLGFIGIIDPPRDEAYAAIQECKSAGIRVIMITGDHAVTAKAIAKKLDLGEDREVITGTEIGKLDDASLAQVVMKHDVFARVDPEHKLRLVKALQANNLMCAMTGDGVNDAPALKQANIGIAMGIKGTEVSKEASEIILVDDNFASIVNAVEEGRTVYDNIRKTILFILPTNGAEVLVLIGAILVGATLPITPVQILWVNMVTAVTLALALSIEPMEKKVMELPPRNHKEPILGSYFLWRILFVSVLIAGLTALGYWWSIVSGNDLDTNRTIAVNMLVAGQLFYLFNCRKINETSISGDFFNNRHAFLAVLVLVLLQLVFTYAPFMNELFGTAPIKAIEWMIPIAGGFMVFLMVEVEKYFTRKIS
ncbi:cation-transporting P-type ATPase [Candidatus Contubernalis alkaliaceticus]|uniref:cation-transporting P-type ATPase n=1 Tax=Candidatus Contubernalis alkaliaceticus TaxID=338645 RepID=UPI001F4C47CC|nr:cation-transporting P-type ATPase [Candidatus Contubernalis alkalaceticus]UNC93188.1 cation-transporting P-type ATPase [Candidatus Contubernalis alkalaceticus]